MVWMTITKMILLTLIIEDDQAEAEDPSQKEMILMMRMLTLAIMMSQLLEAAISLIYLDMMKSMIV